MVYLIQIRNNTFETNSSSTHAFAYQKNKKLDIDFENYEANITPFLADEKITIPIHAFESVEDKLRYFYTQYRWYWKPDDEYWYNYTALYNFMQLIFEIFPKVKFNLDEPCQTGELLYLEDADCIFDDYWNDPEDLYNQIKDAEAMKKFFNEGIIYFGSRDYYGDFDPWDEVWHYNKDIEKITSVTG